MGATSVSTAFWRASRSASAPWPSAFAVSESLRAYTGLFAVSRRQLNSTRAELERAPVVVRRQRVVRVDEGVRQLLGLHHAVLGVGGELARDLGAGDAAEEQGEAAVG